ncbi:MAG: DMT family transporter [Rhodospirillaceae bacterium]|nr:DMT family transporter [Rhodospirillaceae bacterium]
MSNSLSQKLHTVPAAIVFGLIAAFIWGVWPVVSALSIDQSLSALDLTALRFGVAAIILLPLFWKLKLGIFGRGQLSWKAVILLVTGAGLPYVLAGTGGLEFAPAGHFGVITPSTQLMTSTLGSWLILKETQSRTRWIAVGIILCGVVMTGWEGLQGRGENVWIGDLMFFSAGVLWGTFTLSARHYSVETFHAAAVVSVWSAVIFFPIYLFFLDSGIPTASISEIIIQGVVQGLLTAVVALILFTRAIAIIGAGRSAVFPTLVPGTVVILAIPILNEYPTLIEIIGLIIVSIGMVLAMGLLDRFIGQRR